MRIEHKFVTMTDVKADTKTGVIEGYASIFGEVDNGNDMVMAGAYRASLKNRLPKMLWQHNPEHPIGVWDTVQEDVAGLKVTGTLLTSVTKGREAAELIAAGAIDGLSIGYRTIKSTRDDSTGVRQLQEVELWEISLVTFPMQDTATVDTVKGDWTKTDVSRILRNAGAPSGFVKKLITGGFDAANTSGAQRKAGHDDISNLLRDATQLMRG